MKKVMELKQDVSYYFNCPNCGVKRFSVGHLITKTRPYTFGPWECSNCNHSISGFIDSDINVTITKVDECKNKPVLCLIRLNDLYMVIDSYKSLEDPNWYDYLFHEHQCPTNIMRSVIEIFDAEDGIDPHGLFRFVACIDDTEENRKKLSQKTQDLHELFKLFQTDGTDAPTYY